MNRLPLLLLAPATALAQAQDLARPQKYESHLLFVTACG